jgi:hypothetical protein
MKDILFKILDLYDLLFKLPQNTLKSILGHFLAVDKDKDRGSA